MENDRLKTIVIGFLAGAVFVGGGVYIWMDQRLQDEKERVQLTQELLEVAIEKIPEPPSPPTID